MYTVYHLPQLEKVGCTNNLERRMKEQDIPPPFDEYVKVVTDNIDEASLAEETLREFYGYKKDSPQTYKQKFSMGKKITKTWLDSHFVGWNELDKGASKSDLEASINSYDEIRLVTKGGDFVFTREQFPQLIKKAKSSQHRDFYWSTTNLNAIQYENANIRSGSDSSGPCTHSNSIPEFQQIRDWATERGLYEKGDAKTQYLKLQEEAGEVARAILKSDEPEIIDGLGDTLVVLINLAHLAGYRLEDCLASAYDVISKRKGKMIGGTFVKSEDL